MSIQKSAFLGNVQKFSSIEVDEIRQKMDNLIDSLGSLDQLEAIIPFHELIRLPRRDALICFSIYSALLAESFGETRINVISVPPSYNILLAYINRYNQSLDENFIQEGDFLYVWRNKWFIYRLVDQFRKVLNLDIQTKAGRGKLLKKPLPLSQAEKFSVELFSTPSLLFKELAYWKSKTSYSDVLKLVYFVDRVAGRIGQAFKNHDSDYLRKNRSEKEIYKGIRPSLVKLKEFIQSICPIDSREIMTINPPQYSLPYYLNSIPLSKSSIDMNFIQFSSLKELAKKFSRPYRKRGDGFSYVDDPWLPFASLLNNLIIIFLQEYKLKLKKENKQSFFLRLFYETANTLNLTFPNEIPKKFTYPSSMIKEKKLRFYINHNIGIKFIRSDAFLAFEDLIKQITLSTLSGIFAPASSSFYKTIQPSMITRSFFATSFEFYQRLQGKKSRK
ncbi:MAG: hypothetical protein ACXAC7_12040 [Candidatus Hodarchaeales archaeon]